MPKFNQSFSGMSSDAQAEFVARLIDLISEGDKSSAILQATSAGLRDLPTEVEPLVAGLKSLIISPHSASDFSEQAHASFDGDRASLSPFEGLRLGSRPLNSIQPSSAIADRADQVMGVSAADAVHELQALSPRFGDSVYKGYQYKDGRGFGAILARCGEKGIEVYQLDISKERAASRSANPILQHRNFSISFRFVDQGNRMAEVSYCPCIELPDPQHLDAIRADNYRSLVGTFVDGSVDLIGKYSFAGLGLLARLLDSKEKNLTLTQLARMREVMRGSALREAIRSPKDIESASTEATIDDGALVQTGGVSLSALKREVLEVALIPVKRILKEEMLSLVANGDFSRLIGIYDSHGAVGGGLVHLLNSEWYFRASDIRGISVPFRGASRRKS